MSSEKLFENEINTLKGLFEKLIEILSKISDTMENIKSASTSNIDERLTSIEKKLTLLVNTLSPSTLTKEETPEKPKLPSKPTPEMPAKEITPPTPKLEEPKKVKGIDLNVKEELPPPPVTEEPFGKPSEVVSKTAVSVNVEEVQKRISGLKDELAELERQISDLEFNYEGGFIEFNEYQSKITELRSKKDKIKTEIKSLEGSIS